MAVVLEYVQNIWPISTFIYNDLKESDKIVKKLPIPETTKHFVYAIQEPELQSTIYVLAVQNLSERSALDAESLIRQIKPDAVVVQIGAMNGAEVSDQLKGGTGLTGNGDGDSDSQSVLRIEEYTVPTSSIEVLRMSFMHKMNREKYEDVAGSLVLKEIFGVSFNEHFLVAKKAAEQVGSKFLMIESPFVKCCSSEDGECELDTESETVNSVNRFQSDFHLPLNNFVPGRISNFVVSLNTKVFCITDSVQSQIVKSLSSYMVHLKPVMNSKSDLVQPIVDYDVPQFAKPIYPLLTDLHGIFVDIPSMGTALACAQKMLSDVNKGENVDSQLVSEVYAFQIAVEGLRIALNNAGRRSMTKIRNMVFSELPVEDKAHAILAQALRSQTKKYRSIVAVVDASGLAGLRKHWNTSIPSEVENMVEQIITNFEYDESPTSSNKRRLLVDKPVVAVGAGATAILGVSSLSKVVPASTLVKIATFHIPSSLKLVLTQTQKALLLAFGKKGSVIKAAASAEKIRVVAHSVIASAEKTSLSAMRAAFYEIMRKRQVRPIGFLPWVTFGCSMATCGGLLVYGDGIECAAESCPVAPSIACLGRGIESLHQASQVIKQKESCRIQKSIESLLYKFKNIKIQ